MDQPDLDPQLHAQALAGLKRVNRISRTDAVLWRTIRRLARPTPGTPLTILDIASGGGEVAIGLAQRAARDGVSVRITGCDISPTAVTLAREAVARAGASLPVELVPLDALRGDPPGTFDVVYCSLFLHHLDEADALLLLDRMKQAARQAVIVDDLRRTHLGYWLAWLGARLLTRSPIVHVDAPLSVQGAFTPDEALEIARRAGLDGAQMSYHWPQRFLLTWTP